MIIYFIYYYSFSVKRRTGVQIFHERNHNLIYIAALDSNGDKEIYIPLVSIKNINLTELQNIYLSIINSNAEILNNQQTIDFNLAIVDPSTTVLYYNHKLELASFSIEYAKR